MTKLKMRKSLLIGASLLLGTTSVVAIATTTSCATKPTPPGPTPAKYNPIPLTTEYFSFDTEEGKNDITGFNPDVTPEMLNDYDCLDFSNTKTNARTYISGDCSFLDVDAEGNKIIDQWTNLKKIDLSNATFRPNDGAITGYRLFYQANLSSVEELDFGNSIWWDGSAPDEADVIETAYETFKGAIFTNLRSLNFNNAEFCTNETSLPQQSGEGTLYIANHTFEGVDFKGLTNLNFDKAKFIASGIKPVEIANTAYETFARAKFPELKSLDFGSAVFAADEYIASDSIYTAYGTFKSSDFSQSESLSLNLNGAIFKSNSDTQRFEPFHSTFDNTKFDTLVLTLPSIYFYGASDPEWNNTFEDVQSLNTNIYGYSECPQWFNPDDSTSNPRQSIWFPNASWD